MIDYLQDYASKMEGYVETRTLRRQFVENYKIGKKCADCKIEFPPHILQFDHVRGEKIGNITVLARTHTMEEVLKEIRKCDLVCANCHAHRTWMRAKGSPLDKPRRK